MKKILSMFIAIVLIAGTVAYFPIVSDQVEVNADALQKVNVGVDFNGTDNRAECRDEQFEDWMVANTQEASYEYEEGGLKFTVKNATANGAGTIGTYTSNKKLVSATGTSPVLTLDGLRCSGFKNTAITLEIEGLPAGTHTLTSWHSVYWASYKDLSLSVTINGELVNSGLSMPCQVSNDDMATITYNSFEAVEGEPVVITFATEGKSSMYNVMVLNAFEIDGVHPLKSIKEPVPAVDEGHHDPELGLSWTAAADAVSHDVYLGTDKYAVQNATKDSYEYKGNFTECAYGFEEELNHMSTYYWRVDEILSDGEVCTGKVMQFEVRHLAFPTAEGYGRFAKGGRGGKIIEVTTLEDGYEDLLDENGNPVTTTDADGNVTNVKIPIKGSLRYALEYEKGARIVVFKVGGIIALQDTLCIPDDGGNVYVAGQTAPGDGITLINHDFGAMGAEDVIIRNIRVRVGDSNGWSTGGMGFSSCNNCIVDHCSISWATDEGLSSRKALNLTVQWTIIAESLNNSVHFEASDTGKVEDRVEGNTVPHGYAASISGKIGSFHHNLLVHNAGRNFSMAGGLESDGVTLEGHLDLRNNVVYNWKDRTNDGGLSRVELVNNFYKFGPASRRLHILRIDDDLSSTEKALVYADGNIMTNPDGSYDLAPTDDGFEVGKVNLNGKAFRSEEEMWPCYVKTETAEEAYDSVLAKAGANYPSRDYLDTRYVEETKNTTYTYKGSKDGYPGIIDSQEDVGGYPNESNFKGGEAPLDTDHDGMPDEWETKHGLDPEDYNDATQIYLSDEGYTNIELYLNELMGDPVVYSDNPTLQYPVPSEPAETATPEPTATSEVTESPVPTANATEVTYLLGDVDENGKIDAADALLVLKQAAKIENLSDVQKLAADVTIDEAIDAKDALQILKLAAKIIDSF